MPLSVSCFEGNRAETRIIIPVLTSYLRANSMETTDMVVVADTGMLWAANLVALDEAWLSFILSSRQSRAPLDLEAHLRCNPDALTDSQVIETITPKAGSGKALKNGVSDPMIRAEPV